MTSDQPQKSNHIGHPPALYAAILMIVCASAVAAEEAVPPEVQEQMRSEIERLPETSLKRQLYEEALLITRAEGLALLGKYGEIITLPPDLSVTESMIRLVREEDGSLLLSGYRDGQPVEYGIVLNGGRVEILDEAIRKAAEAMPLWPTEWPVDPSGRPVVPQGRAITNQRNKNENSITVPEGVLGWGFLDPENVLIGPCGELAPFPNVIWIFRTADDGLELVHSGPLATGPFARFASDFRVTYTDPAVAEGIEIFWPFQTPEGIPAALPPCFSPPPVPRNVMR